MDQLKGKVVNVVLTIQEGRCMENLKNTTFLSANFNGRILDSDPAVSEDCPVFNTNLVWEIEKKDLRKIRSANQPLRVDCYSVETSNNKKEKFGHVLLDLRSAQILEDSTMAKFKWYKLIGVRNKKRNSCPELYLSLSIRSQLDAQNVESIEEILQPEPRGDSTIPIKYLEDGYIVVGEREKCLQDFSLNIVVKSACNLDLLLPEVLVFNQNKNKYCMCIKIFGIPIRTKQFSKDLHDKIVFEEKIVVRILSSLEILTQFFSEEKIEVGFYCSSDLLGVSYVGFDQMKNVNEKLNLPANFFRFPSANGIIPVCSDGRKPSVALEIYLIKNRDVDNVLTAPTPSLEDSTNSRACGDHVADNNYQDKLREFEEWKEQQRKEFEEWKDVARVEFEEELEKLKEEALNKAHEDLDLKKSELDDNVKKCRELQDELQQKLEELKLTKTLRKKRKSSTNLLEIIEENQKRFQDCEKELLIDYVSNLQKDNENLKQIINEKQQELDNIQKTALTKEQTANLLQELKGLEEKFEEAQRAKGYFKEQWKKACQEIHNLKAEDYRQLQDQLRERREELSLLKFEQRNSIEEHLKL